MQVLRVAVSHEVEVLQLHGSPLLDHGRGVTAHGLDPIGELLGVGHCGRQADEVDGGRGVDDHLLPHGPPIRILEVVDLVEDDVPQALERR